MENYQTIRDLIFDVAETLQGKHRYAKEFSGKDMTQEQFEAWRRSASKARREYVEKKISGEEMLTRIRLE